MARNIVVKNVPAEISDEQVFEWMSALVERNENAKVNQIPAVKEAALSAITNVDNFRVANALKARRAPGEIKG